ncbi:MAG: hypothetical protein WCO19_00505 [Candidatus Saccharibacteria bacterium]
MNPSNTDDTNIQMPNNQGVNSFNPIDPQAPVSRPLDAGMLAATQPQAPGGQAGSQFAPVIADDADLIEKEWVTRAKMIVAKTKDDPREQNKEINKFKADYLKKRYNKDIKVSEV